MTEYSCTSAPSPEPDETGAANIYCLQPCPEMEPYYTDDFYVIITARRDVGTIEAEAEAEISFKSKFRGFVSCVLTTIADASHGV